MHENFEIGTLILQKLKENGQAVSWLAKKIRSDRSNLYRILKRNHLDTQMLWDISRVLNFDFFAYFSEHFRQTKMQEK